MAKSSADLKKQADTLRAKLAAVQKEARKMKKLEDQQAAEEQHQRDIQFALEFVQMAKEKLFDERGNEEVVRQRFERLAQAAGHDSGWVDEVVFHVKQLMDL